MTYRMMPVVSLATLVKELRLQHGIIVEFKQLRNILWYEVPGNDTCAEFYYGDGPVVSYGEFDTEVLNYVISMLEKEFPHYESILIDVTY